MDLDLQAKLLRVLQEKNFERVGGNQLIPFRGRPVFATHRNLAEMVKEGTFREDLYYRVVVGELLMPSLRERTSDIPLLAQHFLRVIGRKLGRAVEKVSPEAMELLVAHDWPGNVRELENVMTRAIVLTETSVLLPEHINFLGGASSVCATVEKVERLNRSLAEVEKEYIEQVLRDQDWNITHSARILDISPTTLRKKISDYGLQS
jgi:DNA-binding NtrC family response regulator